GVGGAADGGPLVIGAQNLGTQGGSITQLRAITNGPAFYATNEWGNGMSAIAYPPYGIGVYGIHQATSGGAGAPGGRGDSYSTQPANGVEGYAVSSGGSGVYGQDTGGGYGVTGNANGTGAGVFGFSTGTDGLGVRGFSSGADGAGVLGVASAGMGPVGVSGIT